MGKKRWDNSIQLCIDTRIYTGLYTQYLHL